MNKKITTSFLALALLMVAAAPMSFGQGKGKGKPASAAAKAAMKSPLDALPASDGVMLIDIKRALNDAVPRVIDPMMLVKMNEHIAQIKTKYGFDIRSFEQVALGVRFNSPRTGVTTTDMVAIASGTFDSGALLAAGRIAAKGKYQEEKHKTTTIYIFDATEGGKAQSIGGVKVTELAVAALGPNMLVFGEPAGVRSVIDGSKARGGINTELIQMAMRNPNAFVSFGANIPASATQGQDFGNEEITKNITAIKQAYGALGLTANGFDLTAIARTERPDQAKSLGDTLAALKQFGGMAISQMPPDQGKLAQSALDGLTITTEGNETQLKLELAQTVINEIIRVLSKGEQKPAS